MTVRRSPEVSSMTHDELVARAAKWLANSMKCGLVFTEPVSWECGEIPDAIGWTRGGGWSILVECKTSVSDFYSDSSKPGRKGPGGLGREKYYLAPKGVLSADLVARNRPNWGLLEVCGKVIRRRLDAVPFDASGARKEVALLYSQYWDSRDLRAKAKIEAFERLFRCQFLGFSKEERDAIFRIVSGGSANEGFEFNHALGKVVAFAMHANRLANEF